MMTLDECVRSLAFLIELGESSCSRDRVDAVALPYVCGAGPGESGWRRSELAEAFRAGVPPSPLRDRVLEYIVGLTETVAR